MRALFLLLLLANVLFLGWTRWVAPSNVTPRIATASGAGLRSIRLVSEPPAPGTETASTAPGDGRGETLVADCVSAGPFLEALAAQAAAARLRGQGFSLRVRESRDEVWVGQWVRVDKLATADAATEALTALRAAGLSDAYLLTEEPPGTVVSLGVFADADRAGQVAGLARDAGFAATVGDRFRTADVFWLDIDRRSNAGLPGIEELQAGEGAPARLELRACPDAAVTAIADQTLDANTTSVPE